MSATLNRKREVPLELGIASIGLWYFGRGILGEEHG
jgi:hypothetical protein